MSKNPDIELLIGAKGGYTAGGESAALIEKQLTSQAGNGINLKINTKPIVDSIKNALQSTKFDVYINAKVSSNKTAITGDTKNSSENIKSLNSETKSLAKSIAEAYGAEQKFIQYLKLLDPSTVTKFRSEIDAIQASLDKANIDWDTDSLARANQMIQELKNSVFQISNLEAKQTVNATQNLKGSPFGPIKNEELQKLNAYYRELEKTSAAAGRAQESAFNKAENASTKATTELQRFSKYLQTVNPKGLTEFASEISSIQNILNRVASGDSTADLKKAQNEMAKLKSAMSAMGYEGGNAFTYLEDKLKTFSVYLLSSTITMGLVTGIHNMIDAVFELNAALTDLRIVMNSSVEEAEKLLFSYNAMAQRLGSTTTAVAEAAVEWQRQGFNLEETNKLIEDSMILSITGFIDSSEAATALTSAMKGYQVSVDDALSIVDKFVATDQVAATSAGNLAIALSKTAANAKLAGLSLDEVVGQLAVVNEVMQEAPESTGTFYNTMLSRMGMIKAGRLSDPETGESLSDVETTLNSLGIQLRDSNSEFRNFGEILDEVGRSWDQYSTVQQRAIATAFAGTRQQTRFLSLMSNWNTALEYTEVAANSAGTATEKFGVYQESLEAKVNRVTAAFEKMSMSYIPSELVGGLLDLASGALNAASALGGLPITIASVVSGVVILGGAIQAIKASSIGSGIANTVSLLKNVVPYLSAAGVATTSFAAAQSGSAISTASLAASFQILTPVQIANLAVQQKLNEEQLESILNIIDLDDKIKDKIKLSYAEVAATQATNTANAAATASTIGFKNALVGLGAVMKAHPIMFLITVISILIPLITSLVNAGKKRMEELREKFQETEGKIQELNSELETTKKRIDELEGYDTLSLVEQDELDRLKTYNEYLKDKIYLETQDQISAANEINSDIAETYKNQSLAQRPVYDDPEHASTGGTPAYYLYNEDYYQEMIDRYKNAQEEIYELQKQFVANQSSMSETDRKNAEYQIEELRKDAKLYKKIVDDMALAFSEQAESMQDVNGSFGEYEWLYEHLVELSSKGAVATREGGLSSAISDIESILSGGNFADVKQDLISLAEQGKLTASTFENEAYHEFVEELEEAGIVSKDSADGFEIVISALGRMAAEAQETSEEIGSLEDMISNFGDATDKIEKIYSLMEDLKNGTSTKLNAGFLSELYDLFPELAGTIFSVSDAEAALQKVLIETEDVARRSYGQMLISNAEWLQNTINNSSKLQSSLAIYYKNDLTNWKKSAEAKWVVDKSLVNDLSSLWAKYLNYSDAVLQAKVSQIEDIIFSGPGWGSFTEAELEEYRAMKAILDMRKSVAASMETIDFSPAISSTSSTASSAKTAIEEYRIEIDKLRDALKRLSDVEDDIDVAEIKFDMIDEDDIEGQRKAIYELIDLYKKEQDEMHKLNNERDTMVSDIVAELNKYGLGASYDSSSNEFWVKNLEKINSITATKNGKFDQEATNDLRKYLEDLIEKAEEYAETNIEGSTEWWNIQKKIYDLNQQLLDSEEKLQEKRLETMKESRDLLDELIELEKDRIKQAGEDLIESLEAEIDAYNEIISKQKESLELREREKDYREEVSDTVDEIAKLQARADALALDDSRSAQLQRAEILEQIAEKQKELNDTQHDHAIENTEDALDAEAEKFEKTQQDKIDAIEDFLDNQERLTNLAYQNIQQGGRDTFNKLLEYCKHYTDVSEIELTRMWDNAISKIKEYGSLANAITSMDTVIDISENGTTNEAQGIIDQMKANSAKWKTASASEKERLQDENNKLAQDLEHILKVNIKLNPGDGRWHYDNMYGPYVYHTGGIIGGRSTIKQNEMMVLAEKGEMMLTRKQQDNIAAILTSKINRPEPQSMIRTFMSKIGELAGNQNINVDASVRVEGGMVDDAVIGTIEKNQRKIANIITNLLLKK